MNDPQYRRRRKGFMQRVTLLSGGNDVVLGANSKRCGLLISVTPVAAAVNFTFDGTAASTTNGFDLTATSQPLYLGEEAVADVLTGEIRVQGTAGQKISIGEWFYLD